MAKKKASEKQIAARAAFAARAKERSKNKKVNKKADGGAVEDDIVKPVEEAVETEGNAAESVVEDVEGANTQGKEGEFEEIEASAEPKKDGGEGAGTPEGVAAVKPEGFNFLFITFQ